MNYKGLSEPKKNSSYRLYYLEKFKHLHLKKNRKTKRKKGKKKRLPM